MNLLQAIALLQIASGLSALLLLLLVLMAMKSPHKPKRKRPAVNPEP